MGILTVREGLRWHLIEAQPGIYDFSSALRIEEAAQREGIQIIWDLFHFGWPDRLDIFSEGWLESFAAFAAAFGRFLRARTRKPCFIAPVNEVSFVAWGGGDVGYLNPFCRGRGHELKRQMIRAVVKASEALRGELPAVRLVAPEPVIHMIGDPAIPDDVRQAGEYRTAMFQTWDMISGRLQPELGGREEYLDVIGVNYYDRNQSWRQGRIIERHEPEYRPFREILTEVYERYRRPLFISETGTEGDDRPDWLAYIAEETRAALRAGTPVQGICLYPIVNHPGWDDDRHCLNGLWDYPRPNGEREIFEPLAEELRRQQQLTNDLSAMAAATPPSEREDLCFTGRGIS